MTKSKKMKTESSFETETLKLKHPNTSGLKRPTSQSGLNLSNLDNSNTSLSKHSSKHSIPRGHSKDADKKTRIDKIQSIQLAGKWMKLKPAVP